MKNCSAKSVCTVGVIHVCVYTVCTLYSHPVVKDN